MRIATQFNLCAARPLRALVRFARARYLWLLLPAELPLRNLHSNHQRHFWTYKKCARTPLQMANSNPARAMKLKQQASSTAAVAKPIHRRPPRRQQTNLAPIPSPAFSGSECSLGAQSPAGSGPVDRRKRLAANARERKRMNLLNRAYDQLRRRLSDAQNKSKYDVLVQAKEYIQALASICENFDRQNPDHPAVANSMASTSNSSDAMDSDAPLDARLISCERQPSPGACSSKFSDELIDVERLDFSSPETTIGHNSPQVAASCIPTTLDDANLRHKLNSPPCYYNQINITAFPSPKSVESVDYQHAYHDHTQTSIHAAYYRPNDCLQLYHHNMTNGFSFKT